MYTPSQNSSDKFEVYIYKTKLQEKNLEFPICFSILILFTHNRIILHKKTNEVKSHLDQKLCITKKTQKTTHNHWVMRSTSKGMGI